MDVTLGGDRLGSGNKNKLHLRNYERSTHNLSRKTTSSLQCGVLYPFRVIPAMRGDTFTIDVNADARTIPTKGPLFGSFKMQIDYFQCPFRLYQAILHNNPLSIGLKMNQVKLPTITLSGGDGREEFMKMNNTCLMKYLGLSGLGRKDNTNGNFTRKIQCIPLLAYYDIFKTYYSNKQEENAYVISAKYVSGTRYENINFTINNKVGHTTDQIANNAGDVTIAFENLGQYSPYFKGIGNIHITIYNESEDETNFTIDEINTISKSLFGEECIKIDNYLDYSYIKIYLDGNAMFNEVCDYILGTIEGVDETFSHITINNGWESDGYTDKLVLNPFKLQNIDDMRLALLSYNNLGYDFDITTQWGASGGSDQSGLPYRVNFDKIGSTPLNTYPLNGLVVKTYQSDLFNNWLRTEWIDGENGISAITAISTSGGSISIDTINLSEKLYNMLNRVAASDGSYEGWQDAVYTQSPKRHIESPVYLGGASKEVVFEEIVQTSETTTANPLGTLAGKGRVMHNKGGHITVKVDEASFIIGIVSLTPRISQTQGNEWYLTELMTMDDLHKPALDGIGFQNLMGEQMAYWDTVLTKNNSAPQNRSVIGKVPAWINYMTDVDKGYGDFAETDGNGFMLLQRNYEKDPETGGILDATTYIDPEKYNYAFAYRGIDAQNFWVQIYEKITARRLMSAKQIPSL